MRLLRNLIFTLAAGVLLAQQADVAITPNFTGDDIEKAFESSVSPKSEFETTAQYESRRGTMHLKGKQLTLLLDDNRDGVFKYDADAGMMTAIVQTSEIQFFSERDYPTHRVIKVRKIDREKDGYVGQNGFGVSRQIERLRSSVYGVAVHQEFNSTLVFPLDANAAREAKNYAQVSISEFFVFDARSGIVLLRFHPSDPVDSTLQAQIRRKVYPLELEVSDRGFVFVQVDGGIEEMASSRKPIRAKQQIHLKLDTQYSPPSFVLNGSPYTPRWRVYSKDVASISMFDHAEALITIDSQKPVNALGQHKVGEAYSEWLTYTGIDQRALCKTDKQACKDLGNIDKLGNGVFYTIDDLGRSVAWRFAGRTLVGITPQ